MNALPLRDFLTDVGYHPLFWSIAFLPLFLPILAVVAWCGVRARVVGHLRFVAAGLGALLLAALGLAMWTNLRSEAFPDHVQPAVASIAALFQRGAPIYHELTSPERYSLVYGPLLFAIVGGFQALLGPTVFATKLPGTLAALASLVLLHLVLAAPKRRAEALAWTGLAAAFFLHSFHLAFAARGDAFLLLAVTLGLWAATRARSRSAVLLGVCVGVAVNLKLHAFAYFLPVLAIAARQHWSRRARIGGAVAAVAVAVLPFLVFPQVSLAHYLAWMKVASRHGFGVEEYRSSLEWAAALLFPALFAAALLAVRTPDFARTWLGRERLWLVAFGAALLLIVVPASKFGAGKHHLLPFVPVVLHFTARLAAFAFGSVRFRGAGPVLAGAVGLSWVAGCSLAALHAANFVFQTARAGHAEAVQCRDDLLRLRAEHAGSVLLVAPGGDESYDHTYGRFRLIAEGMPAGVDPCAYMDFVRGGVGAIDVPGMTQALAARAGQPVLWLVAKGGEPFSLRTYYPPFGPLFPEGLSGEFARQFVRVRSTEFFDVYRLRDSPL